MRVPDLSALAHEPARTPTLADAAAAYRASRIDIADTTRVNIGTALSMIVGALEPARRLDAFTPQEIAEAIGRLHAAGYKRETIRKAVTHLGCVFDFAGVEPNPARDKVRVRLPRGEVREPEPPSADHVEAVYRLIPSKHRLALLWLDWSGARVSSIDLTRVGDYDEPRQRLRLRAATTKTRQALWVDLHPALADAVELAIGPREDRDPDARLFAGSGADALRTSIAKACKAAGIPLWSPHDLRHRRISLMHLRGIPWARIGEFVGQRDLTVNREHVHARSARRGRARLHESARISADGAGPVPDRRRENAYLQGGSSPTRGARTCRYGSGADQSRERPTARISSPAVAIANHEVISRSSTLRPRFEPRSL